MGVILTPPNSEAAIYDSITIPDDNSIGRTYNAVIGLKNDKNEKAIQGGKVIFFVMTGEDDEVISSYEDGQWTVPIEDEYGLDWFAQGIFLARWNGAPYKRKDGDEK